MISRFLDPGVLLYAAGTDHPLRPISRRLFDDAVHGRARLHLSVEGGQEYLFHRLRRAGRSRAIAEFDLIDKVVVWHPFDADILRASRDLVARVQVRGRDAVHAATALAAGFTEIVSADSDFDGIPGLLRLDPATMTD